MAIHFTMVIGGMLFTWALIAAIGILLEERLGVPPLVNVLFWLVSMWFGLSFMNKHIDRTLVYIRLWLFKIEIDTVYYVLGTFVVPKLQEDHKNLRQQVEYAVASLKDGECLSASVTMFNIMEAHPWLFEKAGPLE
jgi:hypothetical protein